MSTPDRVLSPDYDLFELQGALFSVGLHLNAIDGPNVSGADHRDQLFEARPFHAARTRATKILVDYRYRCKARTLRRAGKVILASWLSRLPVTCAMVDWRT
jgi:hypothetical protein